jgi:hypothetical protein
MLNFVFGNTTAVQVLLYLQDQREGFANEMSRALKTPLNMIQKQLDRFDQGGILTATKQGKKKVYTWNLLSPYYRELQALLKKHIENKKALGTHPNQDPADGTRLTPKERLIQLSQLNRQARALSPYAPFKPFVKTFDSFQDYEKWKKQQSHPSLF